MSIAIPRSASGLDAYAAAANTASPDPKQLADDIARVAMQDPGTALQTLLESFLGTSPGACNELANAVTAQLDDGALQALAQRPGGRELLQALGTERARGTLFANSGAASDWAQRLMPPIPHAAMSNAAPARADASRSGGTATADVTSAFKQEFADKATNKPEFDRFMQQVFGDSYDKKLAEQYRQAALSGDFSWLPDVQLVDADTLGGANGAYNADAGVVYINRDLAASDPALAAQTFVEEAGHHLDAQLNTTDTQGDEGEMFRRVLGGEQLTQAQASEIRNENDKGTITVDGKQVEVEFWNPFKAVANAAKAVGGAIADGAKAVGGAVFDVGKGVYNGVKDVASGVWGAAKNVGHGVVDMTVGFVGNLIEGNVGEAFSSVVRGFDRAVFQSTQRLIGGVMDGVQSMTNGLTDALGPVGKPLRWVTDRMFDMADTALDTASGIGRDLFRMIPDTAIGFVSDVERSIKLAADGRWGDAAKQFGMAFVNAPKNVAGVTVDVVLRAAQGVASAAQTAIGLEPPARGLSADERQYLETIYGDSIDYDVIRVKAGGPLNNVMTAHTVGNTIYMPKDEFDSTGKLTASGLSTLGHEAGHVWQNQNGGGDYIHDALGAQLWAKITGGDRNGAYDWQSALRDGASFESMNDEERAKVMEDIGVALKNDGAITTSDGYTAQEVAFLNETAEKVRQGEGAG